ncbi:FecR family protein [Hymenobacter sp. HD11105]
MMLILVDFYVYVRYLEGQSLPAETRAVRAWLAEPANAQLAQQWMQDYTQLLEHEQDGVSEMPDFEQVQHSLLVRLGLESAPVHTVQPSWRRWAAAAAMLLGIAAGGGWLWQREDASLPLTQVTTAYGQTRTVHLPDGSTVTLNGHSTLRYAQDLGQADAREVWLDGEAYFSVKHMPDHRRFVVRTTAAFKVEVLGTTFTVYRRRQQARVVLLSGKVRADFDGRAGGKDVMLRPGELLETRDTHPQQVVHKAVNVGPYTAWKNQRHVFDETPLAEVITQLNDTYGTAITLENPALNQRQITGSFPVGDLEVMLEVLEKSFQLRARRQQNHILLSEKPSSPAP